MHDVHDVHVAHDLARHCLFSPPMVHITHSMVASSLFTRPVIEAICNTNTFLPQTKPAHCSDVTTLLH